MKEKLKIEKKIVTAKRAYRKRNTKERFHIMTAISCDFEKAFEQARQRLTNERGLVRLISRSEMVLFALKQTYSELSEIEE